MMARHKGGVTLCLPDAEVCRCFWSAVAAAGETRVLSQLDLALVELSRLLLVLADTDPAVRAVKVLLHASTPEWRDWRERHVQALPELQVRAATTCSRIAGR